MTETLLVVIEAHVLVFLVGVVVGRFGARLERALRRQWRRLTLGYTRHFDGGGHGG